MKKLLPFILILLFISPLTFAQSKMSLGVNAGVALPTGDFGKIFKTGFGGNAVSFYNLSPALDLTGSVGYLTWTAKDSDDLTFSSIPIFVGARYSFVSRAAFIPYGVFELGLHSWTTKMTIFGSSFDESGSDFGYALGGGFFYALSRSSKLDAGVKYMTISGEGGSDAFITVMVGIVFGL